MEEKTSKQIALLLLGVFIGYSLYQMSSSIIEFSEKSLEPMVYKKHYRFTDEESKKFISDEIQVHFMIIKGRELWPYAGSAPKTSAYFNISIVNLKNEIRWINLPDNYFDVLIYNGTELMYSIRSIFIDVNESEKVFLAPEGRHTIFFHWGGDIYVNGMLAKLPIGNYSIVAKFLYNDNEYIIDGNSVEVYMNLEPPSETI